MSLYRKILLSHVYVFQTIPECQTLENLQHGQEWIQSVSLKSELLSEFHHKDIYLYAAVILPPGYATSSTAQYPCIYQIEGFTGTETYLNRADEFLASDLGSDWKNGDWPLPMVRIVLGSRFTYGKVDRLSFSFEH